MKKLITLILLGILIAAAFATQSLPSPKEDIAQQIRQSGREAFEFEVNYVQRTEGLSRQEAKDHVYGQFEIGSGEHYQDMIVQGWQWKSWYGYSTLFAAGVTIGYYLM